MKQVKEPIVLISVFLLGALLTTVFVTNSSKEGDTTNIVTTNDKKTHQTPLSEPNSKTAETTKNIFSQVQNLSVSEKKLLAKDTTSEAQQIGSDKHRQDYLHHIGQWYRDDYDKDKQLQSSLLIDIKEISSAKVSGSYCFVSDYGRRDNCFIDFSGSEIDDDKYIVDFINQFDNETNQAMLEFVTNNNSNSGDTVIKHSAVHTDKQQETEITHLIWRAIPNNTLMTGISETATLTKFTKANQQTDTKPINNAYIINVEQAFIYHEPQNTAKTKAYFIENDIVEALEIKEHWIAVSYNNNDKKGWLKVDDLAKDRF